MQGTIHDLPHEIVDIICQNLSSVSIKALRLVNHFWHDIATTHLRQIHLWFKKSSFEHLIQLSRHRILKHNIQEVTYIPLLLGRFTRGGYESQAKRRDARHDDVIVPEPNLPWGTPDREERAADRAWRKAVLRVRAPTTRKRLNEGWRNFARYLDDQSELLNKGLAFKSLAEAFSGFSNLRSLTMNLGWCMSPDTDPDFNPFSDAILRPEWWNEDDQPCGLDQLFGLMSALAFAGTRLKVLRLGLIHWTFLPKVDDPVYAQWRRVLEPLDDLWLHLCTAYDGSKSRVEAEVPECREFTEQQSLGRFIAAAPGLRTLSVAFDDFTPYCPCRFGDLVLKNTWPLLRKVQLACIEMAKDDWTDFIERHGHIESVRISHMVLSVGSWTDLLETTAKALHLNEFKLGTDLISMDPAHHWTFAPKQGNTWFLEVDPQNSQRLALENWMIRPTGPSPFSTMIGDPPTADFEELREEARCGWHISCPCLMDDIKDMDWTTLVHPPSLS